MPRTYTGRTVVTKHIQYGENQIFAVRRHVIVLSSPMATMLGAVTVAAGTTIISGSELTSIIVWLLSGLLICSQIASFIDWHSGFFVVTSRKLILSTSPIANGLVTTKLSAISKVDLQRPWRGRLIGYGSLVIRSAEEGILVVAYIPCPQQLYEELSKLVQGVEGQSDELGQ